MLHTPYLQATMEVGIDNEDLDKGQDWENVERHKRDPHCIIRYGVKGGIPFFEKTQTNMEQWLELAKLKREQFMEESVTSRNARMGIEKYALPEILKDEFEARGMNVRDALSDGDHYEIDRVMAEEFPLLLWVPVSYIRLRPTTTVIT